MATRELNAILTTGERRHLPREHGAVTQQQELDFFLAQCHSHVRDYEVARQEFVAHRDTEDRLEAERPNKLEAIKKLLMEQSPGLAATNAEKLSRCHPDYQEYLAEQREAVAAKDNAATRAESARLRAQMALYATKVIGGWNV